MHLALVLYAKSLNSREQSEKNLTFLVQRLYPSASFAFTAPCRGRQDRQRTDRRLLGNGNPRCCQLVTPNDVGRLGLIRPEAPFSVRSASYWPAWLFFSDALCCAKAAPTRLFASNGRNCGAGRVNVPARRLVVWICIASIHVVLSQLFSVFIYCR